MTNQTKEACNERHSSVRRSFWIIFTVLPLLVGAVGLSIRAGYSASSEIRIHKAAQEESDKAVQASLKRIEEGMARQRDMIEDLWRSGGGGS